MFLDNNQKVFFELLRAGLWSDGSTGLQIDGTPEWDEVYLLAQEQSVQGLVLQGLECFMEQGIISKADIPQELLLQWIGEIRMIEQRNQVMNEFVAGLIERVRKEDVYAILVKGQGIAPCYEKPLWRLSGDVDLLLSSDNYEKAKKVLLPLAIEVDTEYESLKHLGMTMKGGFVVELHGMLHSRLSKRIDRVIDDAQKDCFFAGHVRSEEFKSSKGSRVQVFLPSTDNDVIIVFTHILKHFYIEGIGLRQICDWCRLLWTYRESLNHGLLESRIKEAGLMTEWKAFAALAVEFLGMPIEAMPLYHSDAQGVQEFKKFKRKAERILEFVIECGNFGHNRQAATGKISSAWHKTTDFIRHAKLFPLDSIKFYGHFVIDGVVVAKKNKMYKRSKV